MLSQPPMPGYSTTLSHKALTLQTLLSHDNEREKRAEMDLFHNILQTHVNNELQIIIITCLLLF